MTQDEKPPEQPASEASTPHPEEKPEQEAKQIAFDAREFVRGKGILIEDVEGKDISQVYIQRGDRTTVYNIYGESSGRVVSAAEPTTRPSIHRIGDLSLNPLPQSEIDRTSAIYVPMREHEQALQRLREQRLLILHGEPGTGKRTAAIRLLTQFFQGDLVNNTIYELNPSLKLSELSADDLPDHAGFFLESSDGSAWEGLNHFHLTALLTRLQNLNKANALILILEQPPADIASTQRDLLQPWSLQWPDPLPESQAQVLSRHFTYASYTRSDIDPDKKSEFDALIQQEPLHDLLHRPLRPAQLAQLAHLLLQVLITELTLEEALTQFDDRVEEEVRAWFDAGHDPELETLLIAAAVFNGLPYAFIRQASQELLAILLPQTDEPSDKETRPSPTSRASLFGRRDSVGQRLKTIHAHQEHIVRRFHFGDIREKVVKLDNERWQPAVLRYLWRIDGIQEPFLTWLTPYGASPHHTIRTRAAAAIGALALEEFGVIEANVLREWAASSNPDTRRSAAQVLSMTIWDERYGGPSAGLLHYWATQKDNWRLQWTAAAAYAGLAGPRFPQQTLSDLKLITAQAAREPRLLEPFFQALLNFYESSSTVPEHRLMLLQALDQWSALPEQRAQRAETFPVRRSALLGFLYLLWPDSADSVWRLLLQDIATDETFQTHACTLLQRAFNFRQPAGWVRDDLHPRKMALELLQQLILFIGEEGNPETYQHMERFLNAYRKSIADNPHDLERFHRKAVRWKKAHDAAPDLLQILIHPS